MMWRRFRRNFEEDITHGEYKKAVIEVVNHFVDNLFEGVMYKLPKQCGYMFLRYRKRKMGGRPGISFGMTVLARRETGDPNARVYVRNDLPSLKLVWFKTNMKAKFKDHMIFRAIRPVKHRIRDAALAKKPFIYFNDRDVKKSYNRKSNTGSTDGSGLPADSVRNT